MGNLPYVAALWAVLGLCAALIPSNPAGAVRDDAIYSDGALSKSPVSKSPVSHVPLSKFPVSQNPVSQNPVLQGVPEITARNDAPRVIDGDTLALGDLRVRLHGIDAPERSQTCTDSHGAEWSCGMWSKAVLERLVGDDVQCFERDSDRYGRSVAQCVSGGVDVNAAMVSSGAAYAYAKYSMDYVDEQDQARARGAGLWRAGGQVPSEYRAEKRQAQLAQRPVEIAPKGCEIKGNISKSGKLYHLPGGRWYEGTRINLSDGERWFCSEQEAVAAGWRMAKG